MCLYIGNCRSALHDCLMTRWLQLGKICFLVGRTLFRQHLSTVWIVGSGLQLLGEIFGHLRVMWTLSGTALVSDLLLVTQGFGLTGGRQHLGGLLQLLVLRRCDQLFDKHCSRSHLVDIPACCTVHLSLSGRRHRRHPRLTLIALSLTIARSLAILSQYLCRNTAHTIMLILFDSRTYTWIDIL